MLLKVIVILKKFSMSDSIKKYHELVEEGKIDPNTSFEDKIS